MGLCPSTDDEPRARTAQQQGQSESKRDDSDPINRLTLFVIQAKNVPKYDFANTKSDPYVKVKFGDAEYRTTTVTNETHPVWNAQFVEEGQGLFGKVSSIRLDLFDHDTVSADDFIGYCVIKTDASPTRDYSTAVHYVDLLDEKGAPLKGPNGDKVMIQIQLKYALNADDINVRYYTHIMEFVVKKGKNISNKDFLGKSDPYVELEWGAQTFSTKTIDNDLNPEWNETTYLFVHNEHQRMYQLKLCVMDKDIGVDDHLGTGYVPASEVFKQCGSDGSKTYDLDVALHGVPVRSDRGLIDFSRDESFRKWGDLEVTIKLKPKQIVEREFYGVLIQTFDKNNDGVIDRYEVAEMFAALKMPEKDVDDFFAKFDENNDMKLDEQEVTKMLQDSDFQDSELATQLMAIYLGGDFNGDFQKHLMSGFTHEPTSTSKVIKIKDRETGLLIQEYIPTYVWYALKLMYDIKLNRAIVQSKVVMQILSQMSAKRGDKMDAPQSVQEIDPFIRQHNLDTRPLNKHVDDFKTFNDFFARGIDADAHRPLALPNDDTVISSPADCRMMLWDSILDSTQVWIKGSRFTLESLCGSGDHRVDLNKYHGGAFVIARLAPQDYHRWHYPLSGTVVNIHAIDGALYTVNPIAINKPVDVYTKNKRAIVEVQNEKHGSYIMFVIAATMVGSYSLFKEDHAEPLSNNPIELKNGDKVQRGAVAGEFRFGGSTILLLFEKKIKINFDNDIERNVKHPFETLVNARSRIGRIV
eukprot:461400_1